MTRRVVANLPIYIHNWGGLGSQLFALAFILQLRQKKFARRIVLIHHTGGVTYRDLEASVFNYFDIPFKVVDDYQSLPKNTRSSLKQRFRRIVRRVASFLLASFGLLKTSKKPRSLVKPWTVAVRHHYFRERLSSDILQLIGAYYQQRGSAFTNLNSADEKLVYVHHRLGDLQWLAEKGPVSMERIVRLICSLKNEKNSKLIVSSDSPDIALAGLSSNLLTCKDSSHSIESFEGSLEEFLSAGMFADIFVGTNSKISIWIAIFRVQLGKEKTFLPKEMRDDFMVISPYISRVNFY